MSHLHCPACQGELDSRSRETTCSQCQARFQIRALCPTCRQELERLGIPAARWITSAITATAWYRSGQWCLR